MSITRRAVATVAVAGAVAVLSSSAQGDSTLMHGSPFRVEAWTTDDELPQSSVIALTQTRDGYLWMSTRDALVRFDGISFTVFDENNTPGLPGSPIVHLYEDSRTNLWAGTEDDGVFLIREGRIIPFEISRGSREGRLIAMAEHPDGTLWMCTADGQLCRYRKGRKEVRNLESNRAGVPQGLIAEKSGMVWLGLSTSQIGIEGSDTNRLAQLPFKEWLPFRQLDFLLASRQGGYWRMANGRVQKLEGTAIVDDLGVYPWGDTPISAACENAEGNLVVGTLGSGVFWYDHTGEPRRIPDLSTDWILSLCFDREDHLWVGTDGGGLNRVKRSRFRTLPGTEGWVVQSVSADARGGLWIGCNGGELAYWRDGTLELYETGSEPYPPSIKSVAVDSGQHVWVGTWGRGLFQLDDKRFQPRMTTVLFQEAVLAIYEDSAQDLWLGLRDGLVHRRDTGVRRLTVEQGLTHNTVQAIREDPSGGLWIGTAGGGLNHLEEGRLTAYQKRTGHLSSDEITALLVDEEGVLWIGTAGGGLGRLANGEWRTLSKNDGLPSNSIGYLLEDELGHLWLGSNAGLVRVSKSDLNAFARGRTNFIHCRAYGKPDGLPTRECTFGSQPAACATPDGRLWFPTIKGLVSVAPGEIEPNPVAPPVAIESVLVERELQNTNLLRADALRAVTLPPGRELLEIHYTSLNLGAPESRRRFRFRLEGHDADWIDAGNGRIARYSKLPPGEYLFRVTAANEDGLWNPSGATLAVAVLPPFWRTVWFMAASTAVGVALIAGSVYYIATQRLQRQLALLRQQEALEKERARIARDLHDQLGANLTQLALLGELVESDKDAPTEVEDHAQQLCHTARETTRALDEIVWAANPSNDTLEGLVNYVCKYAQDYLALAGLRYRLDVPSPLPDTVLQPELRHNVFLAAKEAVNNIVKHAQASEARIALKLAEHAFTLEIADNGRGPGGMESKAAKARNGLRNMRRRMNDVGGTFLIDPAPGGGSIVRLTAPLRKSGPPS